MVVMAAWLTKMASNKIDQLPGLGSRETAGSP